MTAERLHRLLYVAITSWTEGHVPLESDPGWVRAMWRRYRDLERPETRYAAYWGVGY